MNDATEPTAAEEDEFTAVLEEGTALLGALGLSWERLLEVETVSYATGVAPARVNARLAGDRPSDVPAHVLFRERLRFLHETRLNPKGKKHSQRTVAKGAGTSYTMVSYLLSGRSEPGRDLAARLERFFGVPVGFCSLSEGEALAGYVRPLLQQLLILKKVAEVRERGVESVAARSTDDVGRSPDLLLELVTVVLAAVDHPQLDPGVQGGRTPWGSGQSRTQ